MTIPEAQPTKPPFPNKHADSNKINYRKPANEKVWVQLKDRPITEFFKLKTPTAPAATAESIAQKLPRLGNLSHNAEKLKSNPQKRQLAIGRKDESSTSGSSQPVTNENSLSLSNPEVVIVSPDLRFKPVKLSESSPICIEEILLKQDTVSKSKNTSKNVPDVSHREKTEVLDLDEEDFEPKAAPAPTVSGPLEAKDGANHPLATLPYKKLKRKGPCDDLEFTHRNELPSIEILPIICFDGHTTLSTGELLQAMALFNFATHYQEVFSIDQSYELKLDDYFEALFHKCAKSLKLFGLLKCLLYNVLSEKLPSTDNHVSTFESLMSLFLDSIDDQLSSIYQAMDFYEIPLEERLKSFDILIAELIQTETFDDEMYRLGKETASLNNLRVEYKKEKNSILADLTWYPFKIKSEEARLDELKKGLSDYLSLLEIQFQESEKDHAIEERVESSRLLELAQRKRREEFMSKFQLEMDTRNAEIESQIELIAAAEQEHDELKARNALITKALDNGGLKKQFFEIRSKLRGNCFVLLGQDRYFRKYWFVEVFGCVLVEPTMETISCDKCPDDSIGQWRIFHSFKDLIEFKSILNMATARESILRANIELFRDEIEKAYLERYLAWSKRFLQANQTNIATTPESYPSLDVELFADCAAICETVRDSLKLMARYYCAHTSDLQEFMEDSILQALDHDQTPTFQSKESVIEEIHSWFGMFKDDFMMPTLRNCLYCDLVLLRNVDTEADLIPPYVDYWKSVLNNKNLPFLSLFALHWKKHLDKFIKNMASKFGKLQISSVKPKALETRRPAPKKRTRSKQRDRTKSSPIKREKSSRASARGRVNYFESDNETSDREDSNENSSSSSENEHAKEEEEAMDLRTRSRRTRSSARNVDYSSDDNSE